MVRFYPDKRLGSMDARSLTPMGKVRSAWCYDSDTVRYEIEIPCNQAAKVFLPGREAMTLPAGKYSF